MKCLLHITLFLIFRPILIRFPHHRAIYNKYSKPTFRHFALQSFRFKRFRLSRTQIVRSFVT